MPWDKTVARGRHLPRDWHYIRKRVLARDPECTLAYPDICEGRSNNVDHIGDKNDHSDSNLRGCCGRCHARRTGKQGNDAQARRRALRKRPAERHPGTVPSR